MISEFFGSPALANQDPIGQVIEFGNMDGNLKPLTIVGIAGDVPAQGLDFPESPVIYVDYRQRGFNINSSPKQLEQKHAREQQKVQANTAAIDPESVQAFEAKALIVH